MSSGTAYWGIAQIEKYVCSTPTTGIKKAAERWFCRFLYCICLRDGKDKKDAPHAWRPARKNKTVARETDGPGAFDVKRRHMILLVLDKKFA